jgi:hypothetical protein
MKSVENRMCEARSQPKGPADGAWRATAVNRGPHALARFPCGVTAAGLVGIAGLGGVSCNALAGSGKDR